MCFENLEPPNKTIQECRQLLQGISIGLALLGLISLVSPGQSDIIMNFLLIFMLYMTWAQFNWVMCSMIFLFMIFQLIMVIIFDIYLLEIFYATNSQQIIQKQGQKPDQNLQKNIAGLVIVLQVFKTLFFPIAIYFVHYCYKHFKTLAMDSGAGIALPSFGSSFGQGRYNRFQNQQQNQTNLAPPIRGRTAFFQGQAVAIG